METEMYIRVIFVRGKAFFNLFKNTCKAGIVVESASEEGKPGVKKTIC